MFTNTGDTAARHAPVNDDASSPEALLARYPHLVGADGRRALVWPAAVFILIICSMGADLAADLASATGAAHLFIETVVLVLALAGMVGTGLRLRASLRDTEALLGDLEVASLDLAHWRAEARQLHGTSEARTHI
jgi:hypothetical protein